LAVDNLSAAIRKLITDPPIRKDAVTLGEKLRPEDGIINAITIIERIAQRR
jgi:hypothetical protein